MDGVSKVKGRLNTRGEAFYDDNQLTEICWDTNYLSSTSSLISQTSNACESVTITSLAPSKCEYVFILIDSLNSQTQGYIRWIGKFAKL
jgi:hypothetical protein